uniref:Cadherin domain protein n=1 Tax=Macrostomum lignano TaxID=282301 RepID=A0A1I8G2D1_9PLAT
LASDSLAYPALRWRAPANPPAATWKESQPIAMHLGAQWTLCLFSLSLMLAVAAAVVTEAACQFSVDEGIPKEASIDNSNLYDVCFSGLSWQKDDLVNIRLSPPRNQSLNLLTVTDDGRSLKVASDIDREDPRLGCRSQSPCKVRFEVVLRNKKRMDRMALVQFDLLIRDVNDNAPQFEASGRVLMVKENSANQWLQLPAVTDLDAGKNGRTNTMILSSSHPERMQADKLLPSSGLTLQIGPGLDYEKLQSYNLTLQACDEGLQPHCTTAIIEVRVQDENDNWPQFERSLYEFQVSEADWQPGGPTKRIGRVNASDKDSGDNSRLRYWLEDGMTSFRVEPDSGDLLLTGPVNAADQMPLELKVFVRDHGQPPRRQEARIKIFVTDINDHRPSVEIINFKFVPSRPDRPMVLENAQPSVVAYAKVRDSDLGDNGRVDCRLGVGADRFVMSSTSDGRLYQINTTRRYDREAVASDLFVIVCSDRGTPPMASNLTVIVEIGDQNEYSPAFNTTVFYSEVREGEPDGTPVTQVAAYDGDATANLVYSFSDESQTRGRFKINERTGLISTLRTLDREAAGEFPSGSAAYSFSVQVTDGQLSATAQVEVRVLDVNDNSPTVKAPLLLEINETFGDFRKNNELVGQLAYEDLDDPKTSNAMAEFRLVEVLSQRRLNATYRVDSEGRVWVTGYLDRERAERHLLLISVTDFGNPPRSSSATVTVSLLDLNDNPPVVRKPAPNEVINITSDHTPGVLVLQIEAEDADHCGFPQPLSAPGWPSEFQLDEVTGSLRVLSSLSPGLHQLKVTVTDSGLPRPLSDSVSFSVFVERRSDGSIFAPVWGPSSNWTVLLVIVGASSFITVILVVAIVMLTRRQPCVVGGGAGGRRGYEGSKEHRQHQAAGGGHPGDAAESIYGGQPTMDGAARDSGQLEMSRREQSGAGFGGGNGGGGSYSLHLGSHNPCLYPPGDYDVASADSGHGASEEEMIHGEHRFAAASDHHVRYTSLPFSAASSSVAASAGLRSRSPLCSCILEEELHPHCQERLPLTHCPGGRQPLTLLGEPQFSAVSLQSPQGYGRSLARPPSTYGAKSAAV